MIFFEASAFQLISESVENQLLYTVSLKKVETCVDIEGGRNKENTFERLNQNWNITRTWELHMHREKERVSESKRDRRIRLYNGDFKLFQPIKFFYIYCRGWYRRKSQLIWLRPWKLTFSLLITQRIQFAEIINRPRLPSRMLTS